MRASELGAKKLGAKKGIVISAPVIENNQCIYKLFYDSYTETQEN